MLSSLVKSMVQMVTGTGLIMVTVVENADTEDGTETGEETVMGRGGAVEAEVNTEGIGSEIGNGETEGMMTGDTEKGGEGETGRMKGGMKKETTETAGKETGIEAGGVGEATLTVTLGTPELRLENQRRLQRWRSQPRRTGVMTR